jgi:cyclase
MPPRAASRHFRLERLAAGVHAAISKPTGFGLCNAGIVDLGGRTVVFDSMLTPMAGADLSRAAERCTGRKPDWVVNSHWHGDHIWGNSAFVGSHVVSTRKVRQVVLQQSRQQFDECRREFSKDLPGLDAVGSTVPPTERPRLRGWYTGVVKTPLPLRIVPPEITFRDELILEGSRRSLHLVSYGGGHSPSDVFGYLPDERIIFAGDLVMVDLHSSVGDGWPDEWNRILGRMRKLGVDRVLPGHGPVGSQETLRTEQGYLRDLARMGTEAVRQGTPLERARQIPIPAPYREWGFSVFFPDNMERVYRLARERTHRRRAP